MSIFFSFFLPLSFASDLKWSKKRKWEAKRVRGGSFVLPNRCIPPPPAMCTPAQKIISQQSPNNQHYILYKGSWLWYFRNWIWFWLKNICYRFQKYSEQAKFICSLPIEWILKVFNFCTMWSFSFEVGLILDI